MSTPEQERFPGRRTPLEPEEAPPPKEDLATRLGRWAKSKGPEREKVTAEDIQCRAAEKKAAREAKQEGRPPRNRAATLRWVAAALMVVAAIATFALAQQRAETHAQELATLDAQISELRAEVSEAGEVAESMAFDPQAGAETLAGAEEAAQEVAELQSQYHGLEIGTEVVDGVAVVVGAEEYDAVQDQLKELFTEESQTSGGLDPTLQWFVMWDEVETEVWERSPGDAYVWSSPRAWTIVDGSTARVVWQLHETATGDLLAWVTADYHSESGRFDNVSLGVTTYGQARVAPSDSGTAGDSDLHDPLPGAPEPSTEPSADPEEGE